LHGNKTKYWITPQSHEFFAWVIDSAPDFKNSHIIARLTSARANFLFILDHTRASNNAIHFNANLSIPFPYFHIVPLFSVSLPCAPSFQNPT